MSILKWVCKFLQQSDGLLALYFEDKENTDTNQPATKFSYVYIDFIEGKNLSFRQAWPCAGDRRQ